MAKKGNKLRKFDWGLWNLFFSAQDNPERFGWFYPSDFRRQGKTVPK